MVFLCLRIMPGRIGYLKFLLEGYDGLAMLTTLDATTGLVRLYVHRSRYAEAVRLLESLAVELTPMAHA